MPPRLLLRTFGGLSLSVFDGGKPALVNQRKRLVLMAALAADTNGGVPRERLFTLFWPESDSERARNALNQMVFAVRRDLGDDAIESDTVTLRTNPGVVDSDVRVFRDALGSGRFADAIEAYRGPFLDGVFLRDAPEFERWAEEQRRVLDRDYAGALEREIEKELGAGPSHSAAAVRHARLLAAHDPLSTHGALHLMRALERAGDTAAALRHAAVHAAHVRAELSSEPGPELEREVSRLRENGSVVTATRTDGSATTGLVADATPPSSAPHRVGEGARRTRRWRTVGGLAGIAALALMLFAAGRFREPSSSADSSRVLVAAFANRTGDSTLDYVGYIAADWITQGLSQSEFAKVVYGPTAYELSRSARNGAAASEAEKIRLLSARSGAGTVIDGSYYLVHDSIVISAQVTDGRSARVLRIVPPIAAPRSDPMSAVRVLRQRSVGALATVLDRRLSSLSNLSSPPPLEEAYRQYLEGLELFGRKGTNPRSLERFLSAAQLDSSFMLPLIWAHMMASNAGNIRVRDSVLRVLQAHRTQLAPIDRYALEFMEVIVDSTSEARRKIAAGSRVSALAPASNWSVVQAGILLGAGFAPEALELLQQVDAEHSWAGAWSAYWEILMDTQHRLGDYKAELRTAQRAARVGLEAGNLTLGRLGAIRALIALGRVDTAMTLVRDGDPSLNDYFRLRFLASAARELRSHRRAGPSDSLYQVVLDWFRTGRDGPAMRRNADYIYYALQAGALDEAKDVAEAILADHPDDLAAMRAHAALGVFAARKGDRAGALSHMQQMPDSGTHRVAFRWAAAELKALVAGALHDRELAIRYLVELEAQGRAREPDAAMLTEWYTDLSWLANEPRIRKPRAGRTP